MSVVLRNNKYNNRNNKYKHKINDKNKIRRGIERKK